MCLLMLREVKGQCSHMHLPPRFSSWMLFVTKIIPSVFILVLLKRLTVRLQSWCFRCRDSTLMLIISCLPERLYNKLIVTVF